MTLQLYVLRQLLVSLGFALGGIGMLVLPTIAIQAIHKLGGVSLRAVADYMPLVLIELVPYLLPMAFLLAVVSTYGRLAADNELTAIRMAGFAPGWLLVPGLFLAVPLAVGTDWLLTRVSPESKYQRRDFVRQAKEEFFRTSRGKTEFDVGSFYFKADRRDPKRDNVFYEVIMNAPREEDGEDRMLIADVAIFDFDDATIHARFQNVQFLTSNANPNAEELTYTIPFDTIQKRDEKDRKKPKYMSNSEIRTLLRSEGLATEEREEFVYYIHQRHALAATYLVFLILGVPTGIFLRSGTQLGAFSGAIGYAFLYYVLALRLGKELAAFGSMPAGLAAWATDALFLLVGLVLCVRVLWK